MSTTGKYFSIALKGYAMGAANVVPGVSGGTIALLTGIYQDIIGALNAVTEKKTWASLFKGKFREFWTCINGSFLVALFVGVLLSVFSLAKLMTWVLAYYPVLTWAFFFGLIIASSVTMFRDIKGWKWADGVFLVIGLLYYLVADKK